MKFRKSTYESGKLSSIIDYNGLRISEYYEFYITSNDEIAHLKKSFYFDSKGCLFKYRLVDENNSEIESGEYFSNQNLKVYHKNNLKKIWFKNGQLKYKFKYASNLEKKPFGLFEYFNEKHISNVCFDQNGNKCFEEFFFKNKAILLIYKNNIILSKTEINKEHVVSQLFLNDTLVSHQFSFNYEILNAKEKNIFSFRHPLTNTKQKVVFHGEQIFYDSIGNKKKYFIDYGKINEKKVSYDFLFTMISLIEINTSYQFDWSDLDYEEIGDCYTNVLSFRFNYIK